MRKENRSKKAKRARVQSRARTAKRSRPVKRTKTAVKTAVKTVAKTMVKTAKVIRLKLVRKPPPPDYIYSPGDFVVYPTHGVGKVVDIETQVLVGHRMELFVIAFDRDRMTLRVPIGKASTSGLRRLSTRKVMETALVTLRGRARVKRTMWSRRAQEYEAKINSGDPLSIAEVVRDLHRNVGQPDQSFSERQIYEAARDRLACELAAVERTDVEAATVKLEDLLATA